MSLFDEISSGDHKEIIWNKNGLLFRKWNDETRDYYPEQMRIINKTISFTTDNWKTVRTAIGEYHYIDSKTGKVVESYGINAETIIGKLILGEQIELTNKNGSMVAHKIVTDDKDLMIITESGMLIRLPIESISQLGRVTQGVKLINLKEEQKVFFYQIMK